MTKNWKNFLKFLKYKIVIGQKVIGQKVIGHQNAYDL